MEFENLLRLFNEVVDVNKINKSDPYGITPNRFA